MKKLWMLVFLTCFLFLVGCTPQPKPSAPRIVTAITVTQLENGSTYQNLYTNSEKIEVILTYLRLLDPYGAPEVDPETAPGAEYRIELHYQNHPSRIYRQKGDRFLMTDGTWKSIKEEKGELLGQIVDEMESDAMR